MFVWLFRGCLFVGVVVGLWFKWFDCVVCSFLGCGVRFALLGCGEHVLVVCRMWVVCCLQLSVFVLYVVFCCTRCGCGVVPWLHCGTVAFVFGFVVRLLLWVVAFWCCICLFCCLYCFVSLCWCVFIFRLRWFVGCLCVGLWLWVVFIVYWF